MLFRPYDIVRLKSLDQLEKEFGHYIHCHDRDEFFGQLVTISHVTSAVTDVPFNPSRMIKF